MNVLRFLTLVSLLIWQTSWCAVAAPLKCFELKGYGYPSDTVDLFVSPAGLKSAGRNGWLLWTSKDVSDFMVLNPENKTYLVQPLGQRWSAAGPTEYHRHRNKVGSVKKDGPSVICGLSCTKYSAMCPSRSDPDKQILCMEFWTWSGAPCGKAASDAWCTALGLPTGYGLPVRLRRYFRGQMMTVMDTESAKTVSKPSDFFIISSDYHRAVDRASLMFSKTGVLKAGDLDDLFISKEKQLKP
ncbi:MAG TPA: hypothetical protein V6C69_05190 [Trichormus sp.]|jgi:hypothetical protein